MESHPLSQSGLIVLPRKSKTGAMSIYILGKAEKKTGNAV
jgi:hypothetical protein